MKTTVWVEIVIGVVILAVAIRNVRARGSLHQTPLVAAFRSLRRRRSSTREHKLLGDTRFVAGREIRERLRGRVFRVVTGILFVTVAATVVIPTTLHSAIGGSTEVDVAEASPALRREVLSVTKSAVRHAHVGGVRRSHLVAVRLLRRHQLVGHVLRCPRGSPCLPPGGAANRPASAATRRLDGSALVPVVLAQCRSPDHRVRV